jgi:hypothetical protein
VTPGEYGALGVFQHSEAFLTARLPAEALTVMAIALLLYEARILAFLTIALALGVHPLIAAPGIVMMVLIAFPQLLKVRIVGGGICLGVAALVTASFLHVPLLSAMGADWLAVVRERTFFMFMDSWRPVDWDYSFLPLVCLLFPIVTSTDPLLKRLCWSAIITGVIGLLLTAVTTYVTPIDVVVKGQPWRWLWPATYMSVLLVPLSAIRAWQTGDKGLQACSMLVLIAWIPAVAWSFPEPLSSTVAAIAVLCAWQMAKISERHQRFLYLFAVCASALMLLMVSATAFSLAQLELSTTTEPIVVQRTRDVLGLTIPAVAVIVLCWFFVYRIAKPPVVAASFLLVAASLAIVLPPVAKKWTTSRYVSARDSLEHWRSLIDHRRGVLWPQEILTVWFSLDSPSYLSISQTAGVVFSADTAREAVRRAKVLSAVSGHEGFALDRENKRTLGTLTADNLRQICRDPELGYVVSAVVLDVPHVAGPEGVWKEWNLYSWVAI